MVRQIIVLACVFSNVNAFALYKPGLKLDLLILRLKWLNLVMIQIHLLKVEDRLNH